MNTKNLSTPSAQFIHSVVTEFNLPKVVAVAEMAGSANRLWQFTTTAGIFVVKELPYHSGAQYAELCKAATFEAMLVGERRVAGPRPVPNRNGDYVSRLTDSRGKESPIRLHHWFAGAPPLLDDPAILAQAGCTLGAIQLAGASWSVRPKGTLGRWDPDPQTILENFLASDHVEDASNIALYSVVAEALALIHAGESLPGNWIYTHCDHKPENCLVQDGVVAVLDWDECNYCHPRLEVVESALRWAGVDDPKPEKFAAFMRGYQEAGGSLDRLQEPDFAKWIAGLLEWFCFQARRAAGDWPEVTEAERSTAAFLAQDALATLQSTLVALPRWIQLF